MQTIAELIKENVKLELVQLECEMSYLEELESVAEQRANEVLIDAFEIDEVDSWF